MICIDSFYKFLQAHTMNIYVFFKIFNLEITICKILIFIEILIINYFCIILIENSAAPF